MPRQTTPPAPLTARAAPSRHPAPKRVLAVCVLTALMATGAQATAEPPIPELQVSEDGHYVVDMRAKLAWLRCVEGTRWDGHTCVGTPLRMSHAEASALATARWKAHGVRWRLPQVKELQRLVDKSRQPMGPDPALFPAAPRDWHWSGTTNIQITTVNPFNYGSVMQGQTGTSRSEIDVTQGWAVNLASGEARGDIPKRTGLPVRLVRPID